MKGISKRREARAVTIETINWQKVRPEMMKNMEERGGRGGGRTLTRNLAESVSSAPKRRPRPSDPKWTTDDSVGKRGIQGRDSRPSRTRKERDNINPDIEKR